MDNTNILTPEEEHELEELKPAYCRYMALYAKKRFILNPEKRKKANEKSMECRKKMREYTNAYKKEHSIE